MRQQFGFQLAIGLVIDLAGVRRIGINGGIVVGIDDLVFAKQRPFFGDVILYPGDAARGGPVTSKPKVRLEAPETLMSTCGTAIPTPAPT